MSPNFAFNEVLEDQAEYAVSVHWGTSLSIEIRNKRANSQVPLLTHLDICPSQKDWALPVDRVTIAVYSADTTAFTVAWKAFEQELIVHAIKADLVQLNGYYQYAAKLQCACVLSRDFPHRSVIEGIVAGENVAKIISETDLSSAWGVSVKEVLNVAEFLRRLGYEIRNHVTNPQIEAGYWLIPYAFPTLTPLSVQLRKKVQ